MGVFRIPHFASKELGLHYEETTYIIAECENPKESKKIIFTRGNLENKQIVFRGEVTEIKRGTEKESNLFEPSYDAVLCPRKFIPKGKKTLKLCVKGSGVFQIILR